MTKRPLMVPRRRAPPPRILPPPPTPRQPPPPSPLQSFSPSPPQMLLPHCARREITVSSRSNSRTCLVTACEQPPRRAVDAAAGLHGGDHGGWLHRRWSGPHSYPLSPGRHHPCLSVACSGGGGHWRCEVQKNVASQRLGLPTKPFLGRQHHRAGRCVTCGRSPQYPGELSLERQRVYGRCPRRHRRYVAVQ